MPAEQRIFAAMLENIQCISVSGRFSAIQVVLLTIPRLLLLIIPGCYTGKKWQMVGIDMSDVIDLCDVDLSTCASLGMMQSFIDSPVS